MLEPGASSFELIIDTDMSAFRDVEALKVGAAVEDGVESFVGQAVA
jgi:hypothetical protein